LNGPSGPEEPKGLGGPDDPNLPDGPDDPNGPGGPEDSDGLGWVGLTTQTSRARGPVWTKSCWRWP